MLVNILLFSFLCNNLMLVVFTQNLYFLLLISVNNAFVVVFLLFSLNSYWYSFLFFLVFIGGLLVIFLYLISLESDFNTPPFPYVYFFVVMIVSLFVCVYICYSPESLPNYFSVYNTNDTDFCLFGMISVLIVMVFVNLFLNVTGYSIRNFL